jgi:prefoldin subunit 5
LNVHDQIPAIDAAVARMDKRINRAYATIERLTGQVNVLVNRIERVRRYAKELGKERSRIATFSLDL